MRRAKTLGIKLKAGDHPTLRGRTLGPKLATK